jgi:hypothetical protein
MSTVYNPEAETIQEIERLELEARNLQRRLERAQHQEDLRVLNRLLNEIKQQIALLQARLP